MAAYDNFVLKVDSATFDAQINKLNNLLTTMLDYMNRMAGEVDKLTNSWHSESGDQYVGKYQHLKQEIDDSLHGEYGLEKHIQHLVKAKDTYLSLEQQQKDLVSALTDENIF